MKSVAAKSPKKQVKGYGGYGNSSNFSDRISVSSTRKRPATGLSTWDSRMMSPMRSPAKKVVSKFRPASTFGSAIPSPRKRTKRSDIDDDTSDLNAEIDAAMITEMRASLEAVIDNEDFSPEEIASALSSLTEALKEIDPDVFEAEEEEEETIYVDDDEDDDDEYYNDDDDELEEYEEFEEYEDDDDD